MTKRLDKKKVLKQLEEAFKGITLEDGVSLGETIELDDFRKIPKDSIARGNDETNDWKELTRRKDFQKTCWNGGVTFFDAKGFRFHLPAYLTLDLRSNVLGDITQLVISNLTKPHKEREEGFTIFSEQQRAAVYNAVMYIHKYEIYPLNEEEYSGLHRYWGSKDNKSIKKDAASGALY